MALLKIPQLNYVVFEAIKFPIVTDDKGNESLGEPVQDKVVVLDRLFTSIKYSHTALNTNTKFFGDSYLTDKGGLAPVRIEMKGTFGYYALRRGTSVRTGFERFKEFRDELFNKVQSISESLEDVTLADKSRCIYGLNFYDMVNHFWGEVDIKEFLATSDANIHTKLQMYEVSMLGLNKLIAVQSQDFLVTLIRKTIELPSIEEDLEKHIQNYIDDILNNNEDLKNLWKSVQDIKSKLSFLGDIKTGIDYAKQFIDQSKIMDANLNSLIGGLSWSSNPLGSLISEGKNFIPILN
ncbi:MAG: hypothetical protein EHM58_00505 [Ignavibacteriae bacterium]|nr:MAG: hypothetical protein EHM58_00505 [Ignavibacteriota bacterium]